MENKLQTFQIRRVSFFKEGTLQFSTFELDKNTRNIHGFGYEAQMVKYLPAVQGTTVRSLGWEEPLE